MRVVRFLPFFLLVLSAKALDDDDPRTLQELGMQLKTIITNLNSTNFSELVRQLRPKSEACMKVLLGRSEKVTQGDVEKVVDLINATIAALPKDNGIFQRAYKIPEHLKSHLMVLVTNTNGYDGTTERSRF
jgi:hypothetical protein